MTLTELVYELEHIASGDFLPVGGRGGAALRAAASILERLGNDALNKMLAEPRYEPVVKPPKVECVWTYESTSQGNYTAACGWRSWSNGGDICPGCHGYVRMAEKES